MSTRNTLTILLTLATVAVGCGSEDEERRTDKPRVTAPSPAERQAELDRDPYAVRCSDIRNEDYTHITRQVQYALADEAEIPRLNRLQAAQSIYYALTELCKGKPDSFAPADDAVTGVRSGRYRAEL